MELRIKRTHPDATIPTTGTEGSSGYDLYALEEASVDAGEQVIVRTGIAIELPPGHEGQIRPRSGLAAKSSITVTNSPGTIDNDFRGELQVILFNLGSKSYHVTAGDRIAQLVVAAYAKPTIVVVGELDETARGEGGFGSTGR